MSEVDEPAVGATVDGRPTDVRNCVVMSAAHEEDFVRVEGIAEQFFTLALAEFVDPNFLH
jgi:hypothetical protein